MARVARRNVSLARAISKLGHSSRTQAAEAIGAGRVRVNGTVVRDPSFRCSMSADTIVVDGRVISKRSPVYIAMHKPSGVVTTRSDEMGRKTVYDVLGDAGRWVFPVGRLDRETSGLLLLTNDTRFGERLTNPASKVRKTYQVGLDKSVSDEDLRRIRAGIRVDAARYLPAEIRRTGETSVEMTIVEGKNRQIRRIFEFLGYRVLFLSRRKIGTLSLSSLPSGEWRYLKDSEVRALIS